MKTKTQEKDFQTVTNEYAARSIKGMREELDNEESRERISSEGALDVEVRGDWHTPGNVEDSKPTEYFILLGTGGPAARIRGELDEYCQASTAVFEYQDWFKPWTAAQLMSEEEEKTLLEYAQQFYFGD
jgi:hypothetical protein